MRTTGPTVLVAGMVAGVPGQGGATWAVLQYILGLRDLGWDVWLAEPLSAAPTLEVTRYFTELCSTYGLEKRAALLLPDRTTLGVPYGRVAEAARDATLLINIAGMLRDPELAEPAATRLYLDLDPAFTQWWSEAERIDMGFDGHTHFATVGLELGRPGCGVPTCGRQWIHTLPPIVLDAWPVAPEADRRAWTTVGNWRAYGSIQLGDVLYGQKAHAFRELIDLPTRTGERFELALSIHPDEQRDLDALNRNGWSLVDPAEAACDPSTYRRYIAGSFAEIGVAKSGYVRSRCGWFSDRSVCYLASGRPVLAQDTGFTAHLPVGSGLLAFGSTDEALLGVEAIRADYARHSTAARRLAEDHFRHELVLPSLLARVGAV